MISRVRSLAVRYAVGGAVMAMTSALLVAPAASAAVKSCHSANGYKVTGGNAALTCKGLDYYKGKTITFVAPDNVGGGYDTQARLYAPYIAKYLGATVNVLNIPAGNTIAGMNYVAGTNSNPNGLTTGWMNLGPIVLGKVLNQPSVQFNVQGEAMLGSTGNGLSALFALKSSACAPWDTSFAALLANQSATNVISEPVQLTGATTATLLNLNGTFGLHFRIIPGYTSSSVLIAGWLRGDGCVLYSSLSNAAKYVVSGQAVPLLTNFAIPSGNGFAQYFQNVPTFAQAEKSFFTKKHPGTKLQKAGIAALYGSSLANRIGFVPPKTPQAYQAALRAAFDFAGRNPNLTLQELAAGNQGGFLSAKQAKSLYLTWLKSASRVKQFYTALG